MRDNARKQVRYEALTDAIRAVGAALGDAEITPREQRAFDALKRLREGDAPVINNSAWRENYLDRLINLGQAAWRARFLPGQYGDAFSVDAGIDTPLGRLSITTWQRMTATGKVMWASLYRLAGEPVSVRDIKAAKLARGRFESVRLTKAERMAGWTVKGGKKIAPSDVI